MLAVYGLRGRRRGQLWRQIVHMARIPHAPLEAEGQRIDDDDQDSQKQARGLGKPTRVDKRIVSRPYAAPFFSLPHHSATPTKHMLLPQYMGSLITLKGKPVTISSIRMPK